MQEIKRVSTIKKKPSIKTKKKLFSPGFIFRKKDKKGEKNKKAAKIQTPSKAKKEVRVFEWKAREFIKKTKGPNWYLYAGITAVVLVIFALLTKDPIVGIVFALIIVIVYLFADREPTRLKVKLDYKGISLEDKLYPFDEIESFWIFFEPGKKKVLSLISKKVFMPAIQIQLEDQNPLEIRKTLLKFIPEEEQKESTIDILADNLNL